MIGALSIAALGGCFAQDDSGAAVQAYFPALSARIPTNTGKAIIYAVSSGPFPSAAQYYLPFTAADVPSMRAVYRCSFPQKTSFAYSYCDALYYKNSSNTIIGGMRTQFTVTLRPEYTTETSQPWYRPPETVYQVNELVTTSIEGSTFRVQDKTYEMYVLPGITTRLKILSQYGNATDYRGAWYKDNYFNDFCMAMSDTAGNSAIYGHLGECLIEF